MHKTLFFLSGKWKFVKPRRKYTPEYCATFVFHAMVSEMGKLKYKFKIYIMSLPTVATRKCRQISRKARLAVSKSQCSLKKINSSLIYTTSKDFF